MATELSKGQKVELINLAELSELNKEFDSSETPDAGSPTETPDDNGQAEAIYDDEILISLNWSQGALQESKKGLFGTTKAKPIDLDLGAFVELTDGSKHVVQALGDTYGDFYDVPFVALDGDDRTGEIGEYLSVNVQALGEIKRILVFTFIYEGAANWAEADAVVGIQYPGGDGLIIRLDEYSAEQRMSTVAEITNVEGVVSLEKLVRFFDTQQEMDRTFEWGFQLTVVSK